MSIALNMVVGPFFEPFLEAAINSVLPILDEIILVDTAPGNNPSIEIMKSFNGTIISVPRPPDEEFSFSNVRNIAHENTTADWVLRLDADEVIHEKYLDELKNYTLMQGYSAVQLSFWHHFLHPDLIRPIEEFESKKQILLKTGEFTWSRDVHEGCHLKGVIYPTEIKYNHYGYCRGQGTIKDRWTLYKKLGGCPHEIEHIGRENFLDVVSVGVELLKYEGVHPPVVVPKLLELYPDLGHYGE